MSTPCMIVQIPGPQGPAGANGTNGTDGADAFTLTTLAFTMPAEGADVTVTVADSSWMVYGMKVYAGDTGSAARGTFEVRAIPSAITVTLRNVEDTATGTYADNVAAGTVFPIGTRIAPSGLQGPAGAAGAGGAPSTAKYLVETATGGGALPNEFVMATLATGMLKNTTGTGVPSIGTDGTDYLSSTTGLTKVGNLAGLANVTTARAILGLTKGTADTNIAPIDDAGGLVAGECLFATATGIESKAQAAARAALGIATGMPGDILIYEHQLASGTASGSAAIAGWNVVPLNTEVSDAGGHGAIAANIVTVASGTYRAEWQIPGYMVDSFVTRLFNVDTGLSLGLGNSACSGSTLGAPAVTAMSAGVARFTVAVATQIQLQMYVETANLTDAYGHACGFGVSEVYARLVLVKET